MKTSQEVKFERVSVACPHAGGVTVAARIFLAAVRSPETEERWEMLKDNITDKEDSSIASAAVAASAMEGRKGVPRRGVLMTISIGKFLSKPLTPKVPFRKP